MPNPKARRAVLKQILAAGAAMTAPVTLASSAESSPRQHSGIGALDHVAVPMRNVDAMIAFYRTLGFLVREGANIVTIHFQSDGLDQRYVDLGCHVSLPHA